MSSVTQHCGDSSEEYEAIPQRFKRRDKWLLWDDSAETPRRPHWRGDFGISWSDPEDWHSFEAAIDAAQECDSWGIGYVFTPDDPEYLIDIDGPYDEKDNPREWFPGLDRFEDGEAYMEWSPSGDGVHIPVEGTVPDWWADCEVDPDLHEGVDVLTNKFCTFTASPLEGAGDTVIEANAAPFLFTCYQNIRGESPRFDTTYTDEQQNNGDEWLSDVDVEAALDAINPDLSHNEWIKLGYAVHDYDSGSTGRSLFEDWSKKGSKWDDAAKRSVEAIWNGASQGSGVTVATLVHRAKKNGWEAPSRDANPTQESPDHDESDEYTLTPTGVIRAALADPYGRLEQPGENEKPPTVHDLRNAEAATYIWDVMQETGRDDVLAVSNANLRAYEDGVWTPNGEQQLREYGRQALQSAYSSKVLKQLKEETRARKRIHHSELGTEQGTVAVKNGLLHLLERDGPQLEELKREHRAIRQFDVEYDPDAETPDRWLTFLDESLRDETDRKKLQEYAGYTLWHQSQPFGKALFLLGPTDSGKGTALKTIQTILGEENVASESLENLMGRWGAATIYGTAANIRNEVTPDGLGNIQQFKELTGGGDRITAEYKGEDKFEFTVTQKFLFATNEVPSIQHADEAFYNRCLFVKFPETVPEDEQDEQLLDKLLEDKSGILNWMLEGLRRLMDEGHFSGERDTGEKKQLCDAFGSVLERFVHSCLDVTGNHDLVTHKSELHDMAQAYADYIDKDPEWNKQNGFTRQLKETGGIGDGQTKRLTGSNTKVFTGVCPTEEALAELDVEVRWTDTSGDSTQERLGG